MKGKRWCWFLFLTYLYKMSLRSLGDKWVQVSKRWVALQVRHFGGAVCARETCLDITSMKMVTVVWTRWPRTECTERKGLSPWGQSNLGTGMLTWQLPCNGSLREKEKKKKPLWKKFQNPSRKSTRLTSFPIQHVGCKCCKFCTDSGSGTYWREIKAKMICEEDAVLW